MTALMTDADKYLMDVHGYLVIKQALTPAEVDAANAAIDAHADEISIRPRDLANDSDTLGGSTGRGDLSGMLNWDKPHCDPFRDMMVHTRLTPYLEELLGPGFRLEGLGIITMDELAEQSVDELIQLVDMTEEAAAELIMQARAHWFE